MKIEELIARIRKKEKPERAEEIIDLIKRKGAGYADYAMGYYDDIHMKYDSVMYDNMFLGVRLVKKDGMYGVTDNNGNEIIPCKFKKYSDIYDEWGEMGFPKTPVVMTEERLAAQQFKDGLNRKHDEEVASNNIKSISFFNERTVTGTELVKMSDGSIGIVGALAFSSNNIEVKNADGEHVMFLSGPELFKDGETPGAVICSDENNLYVATYNTEYSYIACYKIGDFEKVWKTPMYGSQIQSITVNDDEVIAFDMHDGKIKYFDKQSGKRNKDKEISTEKDIGPFNVKSHHNLASTNERLLAGVPGLTFGLLNFENELKVFDNDNGAVLSQKSVSQLIGTLNSLAIDQQKNRIFIAFDNKIAVFGDNIICAHNTVSLRSDIKYTHAAHM